MRKILAVTLILVFALSILGCGGSSKPAGTKAEYKANMKLTNTQTKDHPYNIGAQKFAELIKERTKGRITITLYPDGQLGKGEREMLESLQQGTIDIYVGSTGPVGNFSPTMNILDIPFLFRDNAHVDKVLDGPIGQQLLKDLEKSNLVGLAFWENGFRNLTNSRNVVKVPEDGKGLKIRVMENKVHLLAWKTAGLNPTPMAWGEVYAALQQKVIDGQENPVAVIYSSKLYEVQKYLSMTGHVYSPAPIIISKKRWDQMPKEDQEIFRKTALEVAQYQRKLNRDAEAAKIKEMESKGFTVTKDVDKAAWQKAMQPAFEEFAKEFGKDKINAIMNTK
ncbi:TRAP transporter substrate-binding protein [Anaeroselena agilis]|uniref:TRAP transporter substrate-binding protein n=1 Tax=Anaeroselena agilis TaxID=3063788 RepID=A0ABU3NU68_9FIRM|nr:TRAP transporter substrate-binding protein [Selenomonadales bacterium 4137-cl]